METIIEDIEEMTVVGSDEGVDVLPVVVMVIFAVVDIGVVVDVIVGVALLIEEAYIVEGDVVPLVVVIKLVVEAAVVEELVVLPIVVVELVNAVLLLLAVRVEGVVDAEREVV